jgi:putative hydrolase
MTERDEEEFRELLKAFLEGRGDVDPAKLASAAGLPDNPAMLAQLMEQLQRAMSSDSEGVNWTLAADQAAAIAATGTVVTLPEEREAFERALQVAGLWLDEATDLAQGPSVARIVSRREWAAATIGVWTQFAEPVAGSIANALTDALREAAPEEIEGMLPSATRMVRNVGGTLFAMQLGGVVGQLAGEVLSGGDIGIPLLEDGEAVVLPQNTIDFGRSLELPLDQVELWISVRELAHARLFRHARWLRLQLLTAIGEYSHDIRIDTDRLQEVVADFDPENPETLRDALQSGELIPAPSEAQLHARTRLETTLALIEGWVDVVTAAATRRLPSADAIAEAIRRRRASGGPAERALGVLAGLELRPRRLREAVAMWQAVTDAVGPEARDALWSHPDLIPTGADIDDPTALIARLTGGEPEPDDVDRAIEELLGEGGPERPTED